MSPPCVRAPSSDGLQTEGKLSVPVSPQPPTVESVDCGGEDRADGGIVEVSVEASSSSAELCASSYPGWIKSPERGSSGPAALNFSPVNSNLRDLTPSHTLEPLTAPFRSEAAASSAAGATTGTLVVTSTPFSDGQGQLFFPCSEEGSSLGFSRSMNGDGTSEGGGSAQNPPQKKKVNCSTTNHNNTYRTGFYPFSFMDHCLYAKIGVKVYMNV